MRSARSSRIPIGISSTSCCSPNAPVSESRRRSIRSRRCTRHRLMARCRPGRFLRRERVPTRWTFGTAPALRRRSSGRGRATTPVCPTTFAVYVLPTPRQQRTTPSSGRLPGTWLAVIRVVPVQGPPGLPRSVARLVGVGEVGFVFASWNRFGAWLRHVERLTPPGRSSDGQDGRRLKKARGETMSMPL
jgi:hypothetical protein